MGVVIRCTGCGAASVSSLFYLGPDAHVCRMCGDAFELANPAHDRRSGTERRADERNAEEWAEWRSGEERRRTMSMEPRRRMRTPSTA